MNATQWAIDWPLMGAVVFGLFMFGIAYNALVGWIGERKEGYTSLLVVGGVLITLLGAAIVSWQAALWIVLCFSASGIPMIIGDILRYIHKREKALAEQRQMIERMALAAGSISNGKKVLPLDWSDLDE